MIASIFLGLQALLFIPYGLYCLVHPQYLSEVAGVSASGITGTIELQAMYGGLQTAIGVLCALGAAQKSMRRPSLIALLFCFAGLAVPRVTLGLMNGDFGSYTLGAMILEAGSAACALYLVTRREPA
ncbi:MAG: DUF4345 family protein [Halieaceae bacterium]|nr:DUF4345 family protein [Halieaceae bacterium]